MYIKFVIFFSEKGSLAFLLINVQICLSNKRNRLRYYSYGSHNTDIKKNVNKSKFKDFINQKL